MQRRVIEIDLSNFNPNFSDQSSSNAIIRRSTKRSSQPPVNPQQHLQAFTKKRTNSLKSSQQQTKKNLGLTNTFKTFNDLLTEPNYQLTVSITLQNNQAQLTEYEYREIQTYTNIYYIGSRVVKIKEDQTQNNFGFDRNGVYILVKGDHIAYQYQIKYLIGEGKFSQIVQAFDHKNKEFVALKIIKNLNNFKEKAEDQIEILLRLARIHGNLDVGMLKDTFIFRNHRILVFQLYQQSLLEAMSLKSFNIENIRKLSLQIFKALYYIHQQGVIHCDLKPANIMFQDQDQTQVKIIDFGSACYSIESFRTYNQSMYYRAPQVVLGAPYNSQIDIWSFGCILAELVLDKPLFNVQSQHQLLLAMTELVGEIPRYLIQKGKKSFKFFSADGELKGFQEEKQRDLEEELARANPALVDLIKKCLVLSPKSRITALEALRHPFVRSSVFKRWQTIQQRSPNTKISRRKTNKIK